MTLIKRVTALTHPDLPGVAVYPMTEARVGTSQQVLVAMQAGVEIPLHAHDVDADMFAVAGDATVISDNPEMNEKKVGPGHIVKFERKSLHGFRAGVNGFAFVSTNGGIVDQHPGAWDITFAHSHAS